MKINFDKYKDGLVPVIIQDATTEKVLMLGFMNEAALQKTAAEKRVTFYSRSKQRLWTKGETSGHFLDVVRIMVDCDADSLLIKVKPHGPVCHTGSDTCFDEENTGPFLSRLESIIQDRFERPTPASYINSLREKGIKKMAQKVGEEAVEVVLEAQDEQRKDLLLEESADLVFHLLVLLRAKGLGLSDVETVLRRRMKD